MQYIKATCKIINNLQKNMHVYLCSRAFLKKGQMYYNTLSVSKPDK
jgi:hypothetical protein